RPEPSRLQSPSCRKIHMSEHQHNPLEAHPAVRRLHEAFPGAVAAAVAFQDEVTITVAREAIDRICRFLKEDPDLRYDFLADLCGVDWWGKREPRFEVVYHLYSIPRGDRIRLKVRVPDETEVPTVTGVWLTANWHEREVFDMFGLRFAGHPDLRRILMPEDWEGHPLRKDYPVEEMPKWWEVNKP
ncbi:MAG: NADH-quinone oxidoreductase subunit C, partial [candidate division NC10 bacterium]